MQLLLPLLFVRALTQRFTPVKKGLNDFDFHCAQGWANCVTDTDPLRSGAQYL